MSIWTIEKEDNTTYLTQHWRNPSQAVDIYISMWEAGFRNAFLTCCGGFDNAIGIYSKPLNK